MGQFEYVSHRLHTRGAVTVGSTRYFCLTLQYLAKILVSSVIIVLSAVFGPMMFSSFKLELIHVCHTAEEQRGDVRGNIAMYRLEIDQWFFVTTDTTY